MNWKWLLLKLATLVTIIVILVYFVAQTVIFIMAPYEQIDRTASFLLLLCNLFMVVHAFGYAVNIYRSFKVKPWKSTEDWQFKAGWLPSVAILVAARHEPKEVLRQTFTSLCKLEYPQKTIYFLDDSSDEKYKKEAEELSEELGLTLFRRAERHGAKAGIINDLLKQLKEEYISIFDADQNPLPKFLNPLIEKMEKDPKLAFVQTPQYYSNTDASRVARSAGFQQVVFYEYICEGKSGGEAMFCCGTNIVFRREALMSVGGFDESTVTEDIATSIQIHRKGWKSLYYNHVYAFGMGPEGLAEYFKQQYRWAAGTIGLLLKMVKTFFTAPFSLRWTQWWEYILSGSYYLTGIFFFIMMAFPVLYIGFNLPSFFASPKLYAIFFVPYFSFSVALFYIALGSRKYKWMDLVKGQLLIYLTFPVYIRAAAAVFSGAKISFGITQKTRGHALPYRYLWPQLIVLYINLVAATWGVNRFLVEGRGALLVNAFWAFFHFLILSSIFYFNEEEFGKAKARRLPDEWSFQFQRTGHGSGELLGRTDSDRIIQVYVSETLAESDRIMGKIKKPGGEPILFHGEIVWAAPQKTRRGYQTHIHVTAITRADWEKIWEK